MFKFMCGRLIQIQASEFLFVFGVVLIFVVFVFLFSLVRFFSARFPLLLGCFCCRGLSVSGTVWGCLGALFGVVFVQLGSLESNYLEP